MCGDEESGLIVAYEQRNEGLTTMNMTEEKGELCDWSKGQNKTPE